MNDQIVKNIKTVIIKTDHMHLNFDCQDQINFGYTGIAIQTKNIKMAIPLTKVLSATLNNTELILVLTSI